MKSTNPNNYGLVRSAFAAFCAQEGLTPYKNGVCYEHGQFWGTAEDAEGLWHNFSVVDVGCALCDGNADYCVNCRSYSGVGFEEV